MQQFALLIALLMALVPLTGAAQQAERTLSLQDAIDLAHQQSPAATVARLSFAEARLGHEAFEAQFRPQLSITGSMPGLERSINEITQDDGSVEYLPQSRLSSRFNLRATQRLPWTGGEVFLSSRLGRLDLFGDREFSQWNAAPIAIGFSQPIFQFNEMQWERRMEPLRQQVARRTYAADRAEIAEDVTNRFFDAYIARVNEELASFNVAVNDTIYTLSQRRYRIGKIAENELLQSELELLNAQNALSNARIETEEAVQSLKRVLGVSYDVSLALDPPQEEAAVRIDPDEAVVQSRQHRPAFANLKLQTLRAQRELERTETENGFSAELSASYGLNQQAPTFGNAYRDPLSQQQFGINFQIPLFQWGRGDAEVGAARLARERTEQEAEQRGKELDQTVYVEALRLRQLRRQVQTAGKADTVASRRFEVARNRYRIGKIDITDLFDAQRARDAAQRSYYERLRQFWTSYYRLRRLTLYDFANDEPIY